MGRPLTDRWIGRNPTSASPVLTPICNIGGVTGPCWVLGQVGANKYLVENIHNPSIRGQIYLTNGVLEESGMGCIAWETLYASGYVKRITDRRIKTFNGATIEWNMHEPGDTVARILDNSSNR